MLAPVLTVLSMPIQQKRRKVTTKIHQVHHNNNARQVHDFQALHWLLFPITHGKNLKQYSLSRYC